MAVIWYGTASVNPCANSRQVVDAGQRTKVPYHAILGHLKQLDNSDGEADGDSEALREINETINKVRRAARGSRATLY